MFRSVMRQKTWNAVSFPLEIRRMNDDRVCSMYVYVAKEHRIRNIT